jgi:hypothetical protein
MAARLELKEWFLFYGIYVLGNYLAINKGMQSSTIIFPDTANTPFAVSNFAVMGTEETVGIVLVCFIIETGFHACDLGYAMRDMG